MKVDSFCYYVLDAPCWVNISLKDIEIFKRQVPAKHYQSTACSILLLQKIFIAALFCFSTLPMKEDTKKHEKANPNLAINLVNLSNSFNKELAHLISIKEQG